MNSYSTLAIPDPVDLRFGVCPTPLTTRRGMTIGGGVVYPELNFTLPNMEITAATMPEDGVAKRGHGHFSIRTTTLIESQALSIPG